MSSSYHLASLSCHSRYLPRDIFCVVLLSLPRRLALLVLFLHRASRHALFSINAVPLRDTSRVSCVTLCRFRGISSYIGVISCLVTSVPRTTLLRVIPVRHFSRSFLVPPLRVSLLSYLIHIVAHRTKKTSAIAWKWNYRFDMKGARKSSYYNSLKYERIAY